ncbi:hypothetical protein [Thiorhodospira sibirica]|uniref:hypothetical protein n=1 Tax=Thiorhodospira sibirica TaxID=154347 RepID=UPI00022C587C|nr:hypothetical protein [Thiorhodospira sibirica]
MSHLLHPPLTVIERKHLGLSDRLIQAMHDNELSPALREKVLAHPDWAVYGHIEEDQQTEVEIQTSTDPLIPSAIRDLIARRCAATKARFDAVPTAGQIVAIEHLEIPKNADFEGFLGAPLYVVLDAPHELLDNYWHGWMASGEVSYATHWDFILQEQDQPFDPEVGMVQLWNPVVVPVHAKSRVMGQLSPARMQAVRSLAADFLTAPPDATQPSCPGRVVVRSTSHGLAVVTGTPLSGVDDPRRDYQEILLEAAAPLRELAQLALQRGANMQEWWSDLIANIRNLWSDLEVVQPVAVPMHTAAQSAQLPDIIWVGRARVRLLRFNDAQHGTLEVQSLGERAVEIELWEGETLSDAVTLHPQSTCTMSWEETHAELRLLHHGEVRILPLAGRG